MPLTIFPDFRCRNQNCTYKLILWLLRNLRATMPVRRWQAMFMLIWLGKSLVNDKLVSYWLYFHSDCKLVIHEVCFKQIVILTIKLCLYIKMWFDRGGGLPVDWQSIREPFYSAALKVITTLLQTLNSINETASQLSHLCFQIILFYLFVFFCLYVVCVCARTQTCMNMPCTCTRQ